MEGGAGNEVSLSLVPRPPYDAHAGDRRRYHALPRVAPSRSWAGLCPRTDESPGKRRSTRVRKIGTWLTTALVTAAWSYFMLRDGVEYEELGPDHCGRHDNTKNTH